MANFELVTEGLTHKIMKQALSSALFPSVVLDPNHAICVKLQHHLKELYTVAAYPPDNIETQVSATESLLGEHDIHLKPMDYHLEHQFYSGQIMSALVQIRVKNAAAENWDTLLESVTPRVCKALGNEYVNKGGRTSRVTEISVEFVTTRVYRCFEEVDDNFLEVWND